MSYILGDIVAKVQRRIRDTGYSSSEIKDYINDTQNDVFNEYSLPFMQTHQDYTLTPNVSDITNGVGLPANFVQAFDLILTSTGTLNQLIYASKEVVDTWQPDPDNTTLYPPNVPRYWYMYDQTIRVHNVPNTAYTVTLNYWKKPTILSADADVPELPSEFEELLVVGASYRVLQVKDNYDQAGILQNKYDEILAKLVVKYSVPQTGRALLMRTNRYRVLKRSF